MLDAQNNLSKTSLDLLSCSQEQLEMIYSKYQIKPCIAEYFRSMGAEDAIEEKGIPVEFGIDLMVEMQLHKRAGPQILVGILRHHFENEEKTAQACANMLIHAANSFLIDYDEISDVFVVRHLIPDELQTRIDQFQFPLPMIEPPQKVNHNRQTGYRTIRGSLILRNNHHDQDICLDHINRVNAIPLALNTDVVAFVQNYWNDLDKPKEDEDQADYEKRVRAFEKYDRVSKDVLAAIMAQGDRFWLTHNYDKRGRTYCKGYHVTYQGNDWNKACIEFAEAEPLKES